MIASPSARAVASTAAATIAGRAARTLTVHRARQRLTPSAAGALASRCAAPTRSASTTIAIMIGVIITVRIRTPTSDAGAVELDHVARPSPSAALEMRWLPTKGTRTRIPISP